MPDFQYGGTAIFFQWSHAVLHLKSALSWEVFRQPGAGGAETLLSLSIIETNWLMSPHIEPAHFAADKDPMLSVSRNTDELQQPLDPHLKRKSEVALVAAAAMSSLGRLHNLFG